MEIKGISIKLSIGKVIPEPVPGYIAEALESVEITRSDKCPSSFTVNFHADRTKGLTSDYKLLSSPLLKPLNRIIISIAIKGTSTTLMDGFITHQELVHDRELGNSSLVVVGEDVSTMMNIFQYSLEYPGMAGDAGIAAMVMAKYAFVGVIPKMFPSPGAFIPLSVEQTVQQNCTDREYLQKLADAHGFVFYVQPGPVEMTNWVYWGMPVRFSIPQKTLTVDMGPGTNVDKIDFKYDALAPNQIFGEVQDDVTELDLPLVTVTGTRMPPLAAEPAMLVNQPYVRKTIYTDPRVGIARAYEEAQSTTNVSTDRVVVAEGQVDTLRYGAILDAPGIVSVRGVGYTYDGKYYLQQVKHTLARGKYKQEFTLTREGTGSLDL